MTWPPTTHQHVQDRVTQITFPDYFRSGYYSLGHFTGAQAATSTLSTTSATLRPFMVFATRTFDRIGVNVVTAGTAGGGGLIQAALFSPGPLPGTRVLETEAVSSETAGPIQWTISQTLTPGVWYLGIRSVVTTCQITSISSSTHGSPFVMAENLPLTSVGNLGGYSYSVSGSTPGFPTAGTTPSGNPTAMPLVSLRAA